MDIGFIGLGSMGAPIATNLRQAGHNLTVYNRTKEKSETFVEQGGKIAGAPEEAVRGDVVFSILSDDKALEAVFLHDEGDGNLISKHAPPTVHISLSTVSVRLIKTIAEAYKKEGKHFISATVMGRPDVAAKGELIVMAAGDAGDIEKCRPLLEC